MVATACADRRAGKQRRVDVVFPIARERARADQPGGADIAVLPVSGCPCGGYQRLAGF